jgi:OHCU decarboxylase
MTLAELNALDRASAAREFRRCCASARWSTAMADARPFADLAALTRTADQLWSVLAEEDWHEAFAAHPRIGASGVSTPAWSREEQAGVTDDERDRLATLNRAYEDRFGHQFIVCASGRTGTEMLADLERRLRNPPRDELREAAEEQRKITQLRLRRLLT